MSESALNDPVLRDPKLQAELKAQCQAGKPSIVWVDGLYVDLTRWPLSRLPLIDGMRDHSLPPTGKGTLITVHKLGTPDRLYDLQLRKAMEVANARTLRELGPLPSGGLPSLEKNNARLAPRLKPGQVEQLQREHQAACEEYDRWMERKRVAASNGEENDEMKSSKPVAMTALAVLMGGAACSAGTQAPGRNAAGEVSARTRTEVGNQSATNPLGPQSPINTRAGDQGDAVPGSLLSLLKQDDVLLAYKVFGEGGNDAAESVIVVRHDTTGGRDGGNNPCDLIVLRSRGHLFEVVEASSKVVDCVYNDLAEGAGWMSLNENLRLGVGEIEYRNQQARGYVSYTFVHSNEEKHWHLTKAVSVYPLYNEKSGYMDVVKAVATYPEDLGPIPLSSFNPDEVDAVLGKKDALIK